MGLEITALALIAAIRLFPESSLGHFLHFHLVERPTATVSKLKRHHLLFLIIAVTTLFAASELIAILGSTDVALSIAWDMSLYIDAVAVTAMVAAARQIRLAARLVRSRFRQTSVLRIGRPTSRETRQRPRSSTATKANDDEPAAQFAIAA